MVLDYYWLIYICDTCLAEEATSACKQNKYL